MRLNQDKSLKKLGKITFSSFSNFLHFPIFSYFVGNRWATLLGKMGGEIKHPTKVVGCFIDLSPL